MVFKKNDVMIVNERTFGINKFYRFSKSEFPIDDLRYSYVRMMFPYAKLLQHKPGLAHMYEHLIIKYGKNNGMNRHLIFIDCMVSCDGIIFLFWVRSTIKEAEKFVLNMVFNPEFDDESLNIEKDVLKNELRYDDSDEGESTKVCDFVEYMLGLPKGLNGSETDEDIDDIKLEDLFILRDRMRSTGHFIAFECSNGDESSLSVDDIPCGRMCGEMRSIIDGSHLPKVPYFTYTDNSECESGICLLWRRDRSKIDDFLKFYSINYIFHWFNSDYDINSSLLSRLRNKGICYYLSSDDTYCLNRYSDNIFVKSETCNDCTKIKDEIFSYLDDIVQNGIDKDEFEYVMDEIKTSLLDGSSESYLNHIGFCLYNGIPNDMNVMSFMSRFSSDELMEMLISHIGDYYTEKDVNVLGVYAKS